MDLVSIVCSEGGWISSLPSSVRVVIGLSAPARMTLNTRSRIPASVASRVESRLANVDRPLFKSSELEDPSKALSHTGITYRA
jgi:hypothetical protein